MRRGRSESAPTGIGNGLERPTGRAAEAGAEEEDESPDAPRGPDEQQDDSENEGGSLDRESGEAADESADDPR